MYSRSGWPAIFQLRGRLGLFCVKGNKDRPLVSRGGKMIDPKKTAILDLTLRGKHHNLEWRGDRN